jgi:hypothetical protein
MSNSIGAAETAHVLDQCSKMFTEATNVKSPDLDKKTGILSSLSKILDNPYGRLYFKKFLRQEHSEENMDFWYALEGFKTLSPTSPKFIDTAKLIYQKFLAPDSQSTINVSKLGINGITTLDIW